MLFHKKETQRRQGAVTLAMLDTAYREETTDEPLQRSELLVVIIVIISFFFFTPHHRKTQTNTHKKLEGEKKIQHTCEARKVVHAVL